MTTLQNAKLEMYMTLVSLLGNSRTVWARSRSFTAVFLEFLELVNRIQDERRKLESLICDKQSVNQALVYQLSQPEDKFGAGEDSPDENIPFRICHIANVRDIENLVRARKVLKEATRLAGQLESNSLNAQVLGRFKAAIHEFAGLIFTSMNVHPQTIAVEASLAKAFEAADGLLQQRMDQQMDQFRFTEPGFYADYQETRVLPLSQAMIA